MASIHTAPPLAARAQQQSDKSSIMRDNTVVILGANGRFGLATAQAFAAAGWRVLAQLRREADPAMPAGVTLLRADYADTDSLYQAVQAVGGAAVLVHGLNPEYTNAAWRRELMPMLQASTRLASRLGTLLVVPGNVYNYGETMPALLREDTPTRPSTVKGELRCGLEVELERQVAQGLRSVVIRAGDFFGAGAGSWLDQLVAKSLPQKLVYPGPRQLVHAWAYLPDLGRAVVAVAEHRAALPAFSTLNFGGHNITGEELLEGLEAAARRLGLNGRFRREGFAWSLVRVVGTVMPLYRSLVEMSYLWRVPHALDGSRLKQLVGDLPQTALVDALETQLRLQGLGKAAA